MDLFMNLHTTHVIASPSPIQKFERKKKMASLKTKK